MSRTTRRLVLVLVLLLFLSLSSYVDAKRKKEEVNLDAAVTSDGDSRVHHLIQLIGHEIYVILKKPKYKFLIYMTVGSLPSEESTIFLISTVCNLLYGIAIWVGFLFVPRERMLLIALLTLYVGPAIILIILGLVGASLVAFALYPTTSVLTMFVWFFSTSQLAQVLGRKLGLDSDNDGDVDILDLIHYGSKTRIGKLMGLRLVYEALDSVSKDPFQEINRRLDSLAVQIQSNEDAILLASSTRSLSSPRSFTSETGEI